MISWRGLGIDIGSAGLSHCLQKVAGSPCSHQDKTLFSNKKDQGRLPTNARTRSKADPALHRKLPSGQMLSRLTALNPATGLTMPADGQTTCQGADKERRVSESQRDDTMKWW